MKDKLLNIPVESKVFLWVNSDLDGVGSAILLSHVFPKFSYSHVFFGKFPEDYMKWVKKEYNNYDKIFIVGFPLTQEFVNKIDDEKLVIINDKGDKLKTWESLYIDEEYSSCSRLIYSKFKDKIDFSKDVKRLVLYVDDYNTQTMKFEETKYLNAIYRTYSYNRFGSFFTRFRDGYDGISDSEVQRYEDFYKKIEETASTLDIYEGKFRDWSVVGTIISNSLPVNELFQELSKHYKGDFMMFINSETNFVSFRSYPDSNVNVGEIAEVLCDGGGNSKVSGGQLTKRCLEFSQKLQLKTKL